MLCWSWSVVGVVQCCCCTLTDLPWCWSWPLHLAPWPLHLAPWPLQLVLVVLSIYQPCQRMYSAAHVVVVHVWSTFNEGLLLPQIMAKYTAVQEDNSGHFTVIDTSSSWPSLSLPHLNVGTPDRLWYWLARLYLCVFCLVCCAGRNVVHGFNYA